MAFEWLKDAWDWGVGALDDGYDTLTGQTDWRANKFTGGTAAGTAHSGNVYDYAAMLRDAANPLAQGVRGVGDDLAARGDIYGAHLASAGDRYGGALENVGNAGMSDATANANMLRGIGTGAQQVGDSYASGLVGRATGLEVVGDAYGGALGSLGNQVMADPSYADMAGRAAMDRASQEATARAASARGGNANLQIREAQGMTSAANRQMINDIAAQRAQEHAQRRTLQGNLLTQAGQTALQGRTAGASVYDQAGSTAAAGRTLQGNLFQGAADTEAAGRAGQGNLYNAGANIRMQGQTGAADIGMRGQEGRVNAYGKAADIYGGSLGDAAGTAAQAGNIGMTGVGLDASSHDNTNATNANVITGNVSNAQDTWKEWMNSGAQAAAMMTSDRTAKTNITPISGAQALYGDADLRAANAYSYDYKDPARHGAGPQVGTMADELRQTSAADAVQPGPDGLDRIDTGRLALRIAPAVGEQQRRLDETQMRLEDLERAIMDGSALADEARFNEALQDGSALEPGTEPEIIEEKPTVLLRGLRGRR